MTRPTLPPSRPDAASGAPDQPPRAAPAKASRAPKTPDRRRLALLAVDDCASDLRILARVVDSIADWDAELVTCQGPAEFLAALESRGFDALLIDYVLGPVNGVEMLLEARQGGTSCPAIFLTVREDARSAVHALQAGAADFISKDDLTSEGLKRAVETAIEKRNLQLAIAEYRKRLERSKESLEKKNEEIRSFYRTIRSELTTPLATAIELLEDLAGGLGGKLSPEHQETVEAVRESCNQIAVCLNDVLEMGRLEAGRLALWVRPDDLGDVVERAVGTLASRARNLGVSLERSVAPGMEPALIDRQRVSQVLTNLVDRALEFVPAGGRIDVEAHEDPFDPGFLDVSVTDDGPGMAPERVQQLLTLFCRTDAIAPAAGTGAIGQGLLVCHEIVRLHGGELSVESEAGKGTTFSFTVPKAPATNASEGTDSF
jgi:signal transduction histidine kinase